MDVLKTSQGHLAYTLFKRQLYSEKSNSKDILHHPFYIVSILKTSQKRLVCKLNITTNLFLPLKDFFRTS